LPEDTHTFSQLLEEGFSKAAWHGPNLVGSLRGLDLPRLLFRPRKDGHNIWDHDGQIGLLKRMPARIAV
jgi:hypothetical protein